MKEQILEIFKKIGPNSIRVIDIVKKMGFKNSPEKQAEVEEAIRELLYDKVIYCTNSKVGAFQLSPFKEGKLISVKNGFGFVRIPGEEDVYIPATKINGALLGDSVVVKLDRNNPTEAGIKEVLERSNHIAEIITENNIRYFKFDEFNKIKCDAPLNMVDGELLLVKLGTRREKHGFSLEIEKDLGHKTKPGNDILQVMYKYNFDDVFPDEVLEEIKYIKQTVDASDMKGRVDLRNEEIFTIDGDDTKDIDDAISMKKLDNGNFLLSVHIADVTHYVKEGSALDKEAYKRGTSVYLADRVSPMYPRELSNGICSLNPEADRLALTCRMEITPNGKTINTEVFKSVIHSKKQMTYKNVNKILDNNEVPEGYGQFADILKKMNDLAIILREMKRKRGMLEFQTNEPKILVDRDGKVLGVENRVQGTGENLIEDFMIAANEAVANFVTNLGAHNIYRVHEEPDLEKLTEGITVMRAQGFAPDGNISVKPKCIQNILNKMKDSKKFSILSSYLLRCMKKAKYDVVNYGHYGIAVNAERKEGYSHFTSPIRRYPDTSLHRIIHEILDGNIAKVTSKEYLQKLRIIAIQSSLKERDAVDCEREVDKMKMAEYMENFIGEEYEGMISGFTKNGMFVALDNAIEGRADFSTMDDFYTLNEENQTIQGKNNKKIYYLGDDIKVKLVNANKEERLIDFEPVLERKRVV